jgi:hypothetical protein
MEIIFTIVSLGPESVHVEFFISKFSQIVGCAFLILANGSWEFSSENVNVIIRVLISPKTVQSWQVRK